ncbi:hypothetical protein [Endozoicomonas sp. SCSIO W0465]|uniref:hypothetical protein n=1 Tax=Endozoicomonas sp. SCSIO W0465 TaxID=2918516 RepID=UPI002074AF31|nr:hypothetical protein [Endozoicomonas sp. SCSIO W0465]USE39503.1 hypothetical protein MJO57_15875 [Endozoicomonas sp. SCSIO W0465]
MTIKLTLEQEAHAVAEIKADELRSKKEIQEKKDKLLEEIENLELIKTMKSKEISDYYAKIKNLRGVHDKLKIASKSLAVYERDASALEHKLKRMKTEESDLQENVRHLRSEMDRLTLIKKKAKHWARNNGISLEEIAHSKLLMDHQKSLQEVISQKVLEAG